MASRRAPAPSVSVGLSWGVTCMVPAERALPQGSKAALRAYAKALRAGMDASARAAADRSIEMDVLTLDELARASAVFAYRSFGAEVATEGIMRALWGATGAAGSARVVCLPRCAPGSLDLRWFRVDSLEGLERGAFGVEEPLPRAAYEVDPARAPRAVALVPGLLFDARGFRLGYGGGYYDAFLSSFPGCAIGLVRSCQLVDDLGALGAIDAHDRPVDIVVTERGVIRCARRDGSSSARL